MSEDHYVFRSVAEEQEAKRLRLQEAALDWVSMGVLSSLDIRPGSKCLEAGVGAGSMAMWMADRCGSDGHVVGVDLDDHLFPETSSGHLELRCGDLRTDLLEQGYYDFVHCRLLLMHLSPEDRRTVLMQIYGALRPGGWLVVVDPSFDIDIEGPRNEAEELFALARKTVVAATLPHADFRLGGSLAQLLSTAGFANVESYGQVPNPLPGNRYEAYMVQAIEAAGPPFVVAPGLMTQDQLDKLVESIKCGEVRNGFVFHVAWGQRPLDQEDNDVV